MKVQCIVWGDLSVKLKALKLSSIYYSNQAPTRPSALFINIFCSFIYGQYFRWIAAMGKKRKQLSHEEIWDDSALLDSWDAALQEYQVRAYSDVYQ